MPAPTRFDVLQANSIIGAEFASQGRPFFVNPYYGNGNAESPTGGVKTLAAALAKCSGNKNEIVHLLAAHKTTTYTTDYLTSTLDWNLNLTHLLGSPCARFSPRSRVAFKSTYATASNLFTVSGSDNRFERINFFAGVANANPTGCLKVTGDRNSFIQCHIAGIGADENDIADAYSLYVSGGENWFKGCVIGIDTVSRGTADNCELVLAGGARNVFEDCMFVTWGAVNTHQFVKRAANSTDRSTTFINCSFQNWDLAAGGGATLLEVFDVSAGGGYIDLDSKCWFSGAAAWEASSGASTIVRAASLIAGSASATTGGRAVAVTGA